MVNEAAELHDFFTGFSSNTTAESQNMAVNHNGRIKLDFEGMLLATSSVLMAPAGDGAQ